MTRPIKTDGEKRTAKIEVRLTPAEKTRLQTIAAEYGMTASDLLRVRGIGSVQSRSVPTPDREILLKLLAEAGKQGSNLNQIARAINRRELTDEPINIPAEVIIRAVEENEALAKLIRGIIANGH